MLSLAFSGLAISSIEASRYAMGRAQDDSDEDEAPARLATLRNQIRKATKPEVTTQEDFGRYKKELEQDIRTRRIDTKDFDIPNTLDHGNCVRVFGSFREWLADSISGCDMPSGEFLTTIGKDKWQEAIDKHKATYKAEKERLLEVQKILGLKQAATTSHDEIESDSGSSFTIRKVPFKLIATGVLACVGIGVWYYFNSNKKTKASTAKGSETK